MPGLIQTSHIGLSTVHLTRRLRRAGWHGFPTLNAPQMITNPVCSGKRRDRFQVASTGSRLPENLQGRIKPNSSITTLPYPTSSTHKRLPEIFSFVETQPPLEASVRFAETRLPSKTSFSGSLYQTLPYSRHIFHPLAGEGALDVTVHAFGSKVISTGGKGGGGVADGVGFGFGQ